MRYENGDFNPAVRMATGMRFLCAVVAIAAADIGWCAGEDSETTARVTVGPYSRHVDRQTIEIAWETDRAVPTALEYYIGTRAKTHRVEQATAVTHHRALIRGVLPERVYSYRLLVPTAGGKPEGDKKAASATFTFDTTYDFTTPRENEHLAAGADDPPMAGDAAPLIEEYGKIVAEHAGTSKGICLVVGSAGGRLAWEIARRTSLQVVVVENDEKAAAAARRLLNEAGYYGARASVHISSVEKLPYADYMANVIVSESLLDEKSYPASIDAWYRVLRPSGGVMIVRAHGESDESKIPPAWFAGKSRPEIKTVLGRDGSWLVCRRGELPGSGDWSHQYGGADNAACSQDDLVRGDLRPLWFGQPGPRPMPDRGGRNPAPLAAGGNLFVQGDRILFGMDAYNGTVRWVYQMPELRRSNVPRDASNMAAGKETLHVAIGSAVLSLDAVTGEVRSTHQVHAPPSADGAKLDWGYVARIGDTLLGSAVAERARYVADRGEWYDGPPGWETEKVASENLFALNAATGERRWEYRGGRILNSTITVAADRAYFVETRQPANEKKPGRVDDEGLRETYLVAIDLATGKPVWESPIDLGTGRRVVYLAHQDNTLVLSGSSDNYVVRAFDAATGASQWKQSFGWKLDHHGGAIQHPVIVGGVVYAEYKAFSLADGSERRGLPPRGHGCGAQAASKHAFFYRGGYHTTWDIASGLQSEMAPARSGCWLGIIPAGGIVLAPETSSGCSCTHALQTSMAFVPRRPGVGPATPRAR